MSWAYPSISSTALPEAEPSIVNPIAIAAASPATALSLNNTPLSSSYSASSSVPIAAMPMPRAAPCCTTSFVPALRSASNRYERISVPWLAWMMPSAKSAPPSLYADADIPACGRYGWRSWSACLTWPLWITPSVAVAENFAQLVARDSHSRLSRRKASEVVPADIRAWARTMPEWYTELRCSTAWRRGRGRGEE